MLFVHATVLIDDDVVDEASLGTTANTAAMVTAAADVAVCGVTAVAPFVATDVVSIVIPLGSSLTFASPMCAAEVGAWVGVVGLADAEALSLVSLRVVVGLTTVNVGDAMQGWGNILAFVDAITDVWRLTLLFRSGKRARPKSSRPKDVVLSNEHFCGPTKHTSS